MDDIITKMIVGSCFQFDDLSVRMLMDEFGYNKKKITREMKKYRKEYRELYDRLNNESGSR